MNAHKFSVSNKVVCIKEFSTTARAVFSEVPEVGRVYCVRGIDTHTNHHWGFVPNETRQHIFLVGIKGEPRPVAGGEFSFDADHFRLL